MPPPLGINEHNETKCKFFSSCIQILFHAFLKEMFSKNVSFWTAPLIGLFDIYSSSRSSGGIVHQGWGAGKFFNGSCS